MKKFAIIGSLFLLTACNQVAPYSVVDEHPHDENCFSQGLIIENETVYESCGHYGGSKIQSVDLKTGKILLSKEITSQYFAEGLTEIEDQLYQLTWRANTGFIYNKDSLEKTGQFEYETEGWGLTYDGSNLILSDGTPTLYFIEPGSFETTRTIEVTRDGIGVQNINELEYINGQIYANIWHSNDIIIIDPTTGEVEETVNLSHLSKSLNKAAETMNGIAYREETNTILVTGKYWDTLFELSL